MQSVTCCIMCKRGCVGIVHERLRIVVLFWAGIKVEVIHDAGVVPRCRHAAIWDTLLVASYDTQGNGGRILPSTHRGKNA